MLTRCRINQIAIRFGRESFYAPLYHDRILTMPVLEQSTPKPQTTTSYGDERSTARYSHQNRAQVLSLILNTHSSAPNGSPLCTGSQLQRRRLPPPYHRQHNQRLPCRLRRPRRASRPSATPQSIPAQMCRIRRRFVPLFPIAFQTTPPFASLTFSFRR